MEENFSFMAFSQGTSTLDDENSRKKYIGIGTVKVLAVNPTKAQLKELAGYEPQEEPVYIGSREVDGKTVDYARVTFLVQTNSAKNNGIKCTQQLSYFIKNQYAVGPNSGKYQVIDGYGNTAWTDEETIKAGKKIQYKKTDGSGFVDANIIGPYRPLFNGELALIRFVREYLGIGRPPYVKANKKGGYDIVEENGFEWVDGKKVPMKSNALEKVKCCFEKQTILDMFKGNFEVVKSILQLQPNNEIKVLFGIRVDNNTNIEYQDIYPRVIRPRANNNVIETDLNNALSRGIANKTYELAPLHEYKVEATSFESIENSDTPPTIAEEQEYSDMNTMIMNSHEPAMETDDGLPF